LKFEHGKEKKKKKKLYIEHYVSLCNFVIAFIQTEKRKEKKKQIWKRKKKEKEKK
jgi:hypothetical protein